MAALKVFTFAVGATLAALGGGLLGMGVRAFDPAAFDPVRGLVWFAAVVVLGADSALGAVVAAALLVGLDAGTREGVAAAVIGALAVLLARATPADSPREPTLTPTGARARALLTARAAVSGSGAGGGRGAGTARSPDADDRRDTATAAHAPPGTETARADEADHDTSAAGPGPAPDRDTSAAAAAEPHAEAAPASDTGRGPDAAPAPRARPIAQTGQTAPARPPATGLGAAARVRPRPDASRTTGAGRREDAPRAARADGIRHRRRRPPPVPDGGLDGRGVRHAYGGVVAVDGVDLTAPPGRVTALVGPNGAGKSTLFDCLCGVLRPARGSVSLGGRDITRLPPYARARAGLGRTFQRIAVFPDLSVAANVRVGAERGRVRDPAAVERTLRLLGLTGVRDAPARDLPTGTLRRVELGRALAGGPLALLLDEPAAGLDAAEADSLRRVLRALAADGTALLLVEHDPDLVSGLADTVYLMDAGRIVAVGPPSEVLR